MKTNERQVMFAKQRAALDVWENISGPMMGLDIAENEELYLPVISGRYLLGGRDCLDQTGHNDIEV